MFSNSVLSNELFKKISRLFDEDEVEFMKRVHHEVFNQYVNLPVLYAGSGADLEHALVLGTNLVFFESHLPRENISEIISKIDDLGKLKSVKEIGKLEEGGKITLGFEIVGIDFELTFYAEDATTIGLKNYPELESGLCVYFVKVPFPKEKRVGSLRKPDFFGRILSRIVVGGFYLERECPLTFKIPPEELGFIKLFSGYISALSIHDGVVGNLYKKIRMVENLRELIYMDYMWAESIKNVERSEDRSI